MPSETSRATATLAAEVEALRDAVAREEARLDASDERAPMGGFYSRAVEHVAVLYGLNPYQLDRIIRGKDQAPTVEPFGLSRWELDKAADLLRGEVALWSKLATMRLTTDAEAEVYRRNAYILEQLAQGLST